MKDIYYWLPILLNNRKCGVGTELTLLAGRRVCLLGGAVCDGEVVDDDAVALLVKETYRVKETYNRLKETYKRVDDTATSFGYKE